MMHTLTATGAKPSILGFPDGQKLIPGGASIEIGEKTLKHPQVQAYIANKWVHATPVAAPAVDEPAAAPKPAVAAPSKRGGKVNDSGEPS